MTGRPSYMNTQKFGRDQVFPHHLRFSSTTKGHVFAWLKLDSPEVDFNLLKDKWTLTATDLPERLTLLDSLPLASGNSSRRQGRFVQKRRGISPALSQVCQIPQWTPPALQSPPPLPPPLPPPPQQVQVNLPRGQGTVVSVGSKDTTLVHAQLRSSYLFVFVSISSLLCTSAWSSPYF